MVDSVSKGKILLIVFFFFSFFGGLVFCLQNALPIGLPG